MSLNIVNSFKTLIPAGTGTWIELGRTTLGSPSDIISVTGLPNKKYYMLLTDRRPVGGDAGTELRFNNDSTNIYVNRKSFNGGTDTTLINQTSTAFGPDGPGTNNFDVDFISNLSTKEKLVIHQFGGNDASGAGTPPRRIEGVAKWTNTVNTINRIDGVNLSAGDLDTGSEIVVLGWSPGDPQNTNFWAELTTKIQQSGNTSSITTDAFAAKKYLWIQGYIQNGSTAVRNALFRFNGDGTATYAHRRSQNGGTDSAQANQLQAIITDGFTNETGFFNMFIINNLANEKLVTGYSIFSNLAGAGQAPNRVEYTAKWVNTASQITTFTLRDSVSTDAFADGTTIKVWGSD